MYIYNDIFKKTITNTYGDKGTEWLEKLTIIIEQCAQQWRLSDLEPYASLTYNYVLAGEMRGKPIVLKLRCDQTELEKEIAALREFEGYGCVKVLAHDTKLGAVFLDRVVPGDSLVSLFPHDDEKATHIAVDLMCTLHRNPVSVANRFSTLEQTIPSFTKEPEVLAPFLSLCMLENLDNSC